MYIWQYLVVFGGIWRYLTNILAVFGTYIGGNNMYTVNCLFSFYTVQTSLFRTINNGGIKHINSCLIYFLSPFCYSLHGEREREALKKDWAIKFEYFYKIFYFFPKIYAYFCIQARKFSIIKM